MNFKISLKPYPGTPYFTVTEHQRKFSDSVNINDELYNAEVLVRELFKISSDFRFSTTTKTEMDKFVKLYDNYLVKDDPSSGVDNSLLNEGKSTSTALIDLSFSFPQITTDLTSYDAILIDIAASLGVPSETVILFSKHIGSKWPKTLVTKQGKPKDIYLLSKVMDDLKTKGEELLIRESNYKAAVLYQLLDSHDKLKIIVEKETRSKTMITGACETDYLLQIEKLGYEVLSQSDDKTAIFTIANYPTHSKELIEMFADRVAVL